MNARCVHRQHSNSLHAGGLKCSVPMSRDDRIGTNLCNCPRYETADQRHERVTGRMVGAFRALDEYHAAVDALIEALEHPRSTAGYEITSAVRNVIEAKRKWEGAL